MIQASPFQSNYRAEIDGLRAFAVLSVVVFHAFPDWLKGGFVGVDIFFVISGFLITSHIFENLDIGKFSFINFFDRRIRRIFPALIVVMASSLTFGWFALLADEFAQLSKHIASGAAFITNFILVEESGYFDNAAETKPMLHLWSLAVEEQFYLFWPFFLWLGWKAKLNLLTLTIAVAGISFYLNLYFINTHPKETFFWPIGRFWQILSGSVLAWFLLYKSKTLSQCKLWIDKLLVRVIYSKELKADGSTTSNILSFSGLSLLAFGIGHIDESMPFPSKWALIPVFGTLLVIASGSKAWLNRVLLMNPIAIWFGLISYPLYLWHWPVLSFLQIIDGETAQRDARILAVVLSIFLAWTTYRFIEKPIRFGGNKIPKSISLIAIISSLGAVGLYFSCIGGITPYNLKLEFISEAKNDWAYPNGLVKRDGYWATSKNPVKVVMFGDSTIEAFGPRIVDQYNAGAIKEVAFATIGGCAPLPNAYRNNDTYIHKCSNHFDRFRKALESNPVEIIIVGGAYFPYFDGNEPAVFIDSEGHEISTSSEIGKKKTLDKFSKFIENLQDDYKVVVISQAVNSPNFDPNNILRSPNEGRSFPLTASLNTEPFRIDDKLEIEIQDLLRPLGVDFVSQSKKVCPNGICFPLTDEGKPKYKDTYHMRPFFAKEYMDILDPYVLLPK